MQDASPQAAVITPGAPHGLSVRGLVEVFYAPAKLFAELKSHPRVLLPYLFLGIILWLVMFLMADLIVDAQISSPRFQEQLQSQGQTIPQEQLRTGMKLFTIIGGPVVYLLVVPLLASALAMFVGNFVFAGQVRFKHILSVMLYGELIWVTGALVAALMSVMRGEIASPLSLKFLAKNEEFGSPLYLLTSKIELFQLWEWAVIGIGLSVLYGVSRTKGLLMAMLSMGVLTVIYLAYSTVAYM